MEAMLEEAAQALRNPPQNISQSIDESPDVRIPLRAAARELTQAKISLVKGQLLWNELRFPNRTHGLHALRFSVPVGSPMELDLVLWQSCPSKIGVFSVADSRNFRIPKVDSQTWDVEPNVQVAGVTLPENNRIAFGSLPLPELSPSHEFILWFSTDGQQECSDFEIKLLLFATKQGTAAERLGAHEICEHMGLTTNVPKFTSTPEGVRGALQELHDRLARKDVTASLYGRLLHQVRAALPELMVSTTPGTGHWQQIDFPHGHCTAVRFRVPDVGGKKANLFGAIRGTQPFQMGWDRSGTKQGDCFMRLMPDAQQLETRFVVFSHAYGLLESGQEISLWIDTPLKSPSPVFVALTVQPHDDNRLYYNEPWTFGGLIGVEVPSPAAPERCTVLGWHERIIAQLEFTADSRRLLSADFSGHVRVWNMESQQLEGRIDAPFTATQTAVLTDPTSRHLLMLEPNTRAIRRWDLDSRQPATSIDIGWQQNEHIPAFACGRHQWVAAIHGYNRDSRSRFTIRDLASNQLAEHLVEGNHKITSMVFLPTSNTFAVGNTRVAVDSDTQTTRSITSVQLWSGDFSQPLQQWPLGDHRIEPVEQFEQAEHVEHKTNPVQLSRSLNGRRLAAICRRGQVMVWDTATTTELMSQTVEQPLLNVSLAPDGESVAVICEKSSAVTVWTLANAQQTSLWQADDIPVTHVTHSADGKWVATANTDGVIRLWKNVP